MKQIPNLFTLLNLFFGCLAVVTSLQSGLTIVLDGYGEQLVEIPESIFMASIFIGIAAIIDFLDGFVARLFKATSEIGKQLDSLADVVSFGVAPSIIVYQFLRLSFAQQEGGLDVNTLWLMPAFIIPCCGAYRLARYNLDTQETSSFKGVPIPAVGLLIASYPIVYWYSGNANYLINLLRNQWFWYAIIILVSYLMVSTLPMLSLKFKGVSFKNLLPIILILLISFIAAFFVGWFAVTIGFITYVIVSLLFKN
ncbi:MAG: CDP-diacylglycerol--serine O-phosphatidyltransferase [Chitinophagaceae bacterium]|nr:CDP-diacylglycerol--serine O-phosphatidyltransferase [Chitinophagaceae bacterium]MCC6635017.1 CDP-diacylglycerol--serine O-phosphatidyltransferase [Chitinophagaceae bacterium]